MPSILDIAKLTVAADWKRSKTPEIANWLGRILEVNKMEKMKAIEPKQLEIYKKKWEEWDRLWNTEELSALIY